MNSMVNYQSTHEIYFTLGYQYAKIKTMDENILKVKCIVPLIVMWINNNEIFFKCK